MASMGCGTGNPHGEDQSQRRRHRLGASPRLYGCGPDGEVPLRAEARERTPLWPHHDVLCRRSRRGHDHREVLMCEEGGNDTVNRVMLVSAARTPLGAFCGKLEALSEQQLGAAAMRETV